MKTRLKFWFWFPPRFVFCILILGCAAPPFQAIGVPVQIQRSEYLEVDGAKLFLMTRGSDRRAPVFLWLHGGPGGPERPLFRYFNDDLESHFVVAYWDQRGAGRSFDPKADPRLLTISRHLADLDVVVDHLRQILGQDKIVLVGHSWGSALGLLYVQNHPEKVSAFVGVAQLVSLLKAQQAQYDFVLAEAARRKDETILTRLREIGAPPNDTVEHQFAMEDLADRYGGVFHKKPCKMCVIFRSLITGLVTPLELISFHHGIYTSLATMTPELLTLDLERTVPSVDVPVFFFLGQFDRHLDSGIAADYFNVLRAPVKRLIWFENSAHNVPFEEPELFNANVISTLKSIGIRLENQSKSDRVGVPNRRL